MSISKGFRYKDEKGKVTDYEYGVDGSNVTQDANHRLVTDEEKKKWNGKADPEDIPSGSAASYSVANNDTTTQAGFVADARIVKQHGDEIDQLISELKFPDGTKFYPDIQDGEYGFNTAADRGADTFHPFSKDFFKVARMYHTAAALNASYTAYHNYFVIPRDDLKSISFTCNAMSDMAENDVLAYNLPCVFIGSVVSYELLQQNGVILISPGRDVGNHKVKTVIYRNGSYTFDDFSDCYDYVAFGLGHWNGDYSRYYLTDVSIKLK